MNTHRRSSSKLQFSLEHLESRMLLSATAITFDPEGTYIKGGVGTINGVKYIDLGGGGDGGNVNGIPTGGGKSPSRAIVFATDLDNDEIVDANEITGIAVSDAVKMTIFGNVNGDIVTNLRGNGDLSGDLLDGAELLKNNVKEITIHGSVFGNIIAGQGLNRLKVDGSVENLIVGSAANGMSFHFRGPDGPAVAFDPLVRGTNDGGGSINGVEIGTGVVGIYAGDGGPSGDGGNVEDVTIKIDTGGMIIQAGNGGDDTNQSGGEGGQVSDVAIASSEGATLLAGHGGNSTEDGGVGGEGGDVLDIRVIANGTISVIAGDGGTNEADNAEGGDAGEVLNARVAGTIVDMNAGDGGDGNKYGGLGGSISKVKGITSSEANFTAGHGGDSDTDAGDGGDVKSLTMLRGNESAFIRAIVAGDGGSSATDNGDGGSITSVKFLGDIGDFMSSYGVSDMGGLFAGIAGTAVGGEGSNGSVNGIDALRIAAIVAGTDDAPQAVKQISGIKAAALGANYDSDSDNKGVDEPAFDYFESILPGDQFNIGEIPIDGLVMGTKISNLPVSALFKFETSTGTQAGELDPHTED